MCNETDKRVVFDMDYCKSCNLCVKVCPKDIIFIGEKLNGQGYLAAEVTEQDKCISCALCAQICPDTVISVYRPKKIKRTLEK